jgi:hypothetical protein
MSERILTNALASRVLPHSLIEASRKEPTIRFCSAHKPAEGLTPQEELSRATWTKLVFNVSVVFVLRLAMGHTALVSMYQICGRNPALRPRAAVSTHANGGKLRGKHFALVAGVSVAIALPALADGAAASDAVLGAGALAGVAGLGGLLMATDPQKRREQMRDGSGGDEMKSVKDYFESSGANQLTRGRFALLLQQDAREQWASQPQNSTNHQAADLSIKYAPLSSP